MKLPKLPQFPKQIPKFSARTVDFKRIGQQINNYLDGKVTNKFVNHPAVRWGVLAVVVVYLVVGVIAGWKTYKVKSESLNIRRILTIYPFPAVLMPQDVILMREYLTQLSYIRHFADKTKQPLPPDNELRAQLISQLTESRLLLQALKTYNVRVTSGDIDAVYGKIAESNGGNQELEKLLRDLYGMEKNDFRLVIRDQLLREKVSKEVLTQVQARHILIRDESKAKEILEQIKKEPAKFDELAKQHSEDTANRENGGDLGSFGRGVMEQTFEDAAFKLKKDEVTQELVKTQYGFHIIKVTDRKGKVDKKYEDFMNDLKKNKKIWVVYK